MLKSQSRFLEFTVISAEGLRIGNRSIKENVFVTVQSGSHDFQSTAVDRDGGSYPYWNQKLQLPLPASANSLGVEVRCKTASGSKMVGTVNIPMSDIVGGYIPAHLLHFLSYRLRDSTGRRNGIVNLSVKMVGPQVGHQIPPPLEKNYGGIAVGIPVSYQY